VNRRWGAPLVALALSPVAGCAGGGEDAAGPPPERPVTTTTSLAPSTHLFAEPVTARLDVVVDEDAVDAETVEVETDFEPYEVIGERHAREQRGRLTRMRHEYTLRCLLIACIPEVLPSAAGEAETGRGERTTIRLAPAMVAYTDPESGEEQVRRVVWPRLDSVSRITASEIPSFGFVFKTSVTPLAELTYRVPPPLLAAGLLLGTFALLALPVWLVVGWGRSRRPPPPVDEPEAPPLERALRLVEWANGRQNGTERREALEVLAVELEAAERAGLADRARILAWSPTSPSPDEAGELVHAVRRERVGTA
jgi:hypothetical protein